MNDFKLAFSNMPTIHNEVFATYLNQIMSLLSADAKQALNSVTQGSIARLSLAYPGRLNAFKQLLGDCIPPTDTVILQNSFIPPMRLTCSTQNYGRLNEHALHGTRVAVGILTGTSSRRLGKGMLNNEIGMCLECMEEDRVTFGRAYVKRQWVLSSVSVCTKHRSPLFMSCERCRGLMSYKTRLHRLNRRCACGTSLAPCVDEKNKELMNSELHLSEAVDALFKLGEIAHLDSRHVHHAYRNQAQNLGLLDNWRNGVDVGRLAEQRLHRHVLERDVVKWGYGRAVQMMMFGKGYLAGIMQNAVVICTLFDDAAHFQAEVLKSASLDQSGPQSPRVRRTAVTAKGIATASERYKASIRAYVRLNPHASRTEVRRACSYEVQALSHHEPESLNVLLPAARRMTRCPERAEAYRQRRNDEDVNFAMRIRSRKSEWMISPPAFRVSSERLLKGLLTHARLGKYPLDYTHTIAALDECSETPEQFEMRKLLASCCTSGDKL